MQSSQLRLWQPKIAKYFEIDLRSLAVFRIALGALILLDLATRLPDLRGHYTDAGVWPRSLALQEAATDRHWYFSLHLLGGSTAFEATLFALAAALAIALLVGYRTRVVTVLSWILLISLHTRMQRVVNSGDMLLRMFLFWGMFLPLGARWSLDARHGKLGSARAVLSAASVALLLQVCIVYWFTAAYKWSPGWTASGDALRDVLSMQTLTSQFGSSLLAHPGLLRLLTFATISLEILGPILLFVPFANGLLRTLMVFVFWIFHLGALGTMMKIGLFPLISAVGWLIFLPPGFWEKLLHRTPPEPGNLLQSPRGLNAVVGMVFALILLWNLRDLNPRRFALLPHAIDPLMYVANLDQKWAMFSGKRTSEIWQFVPAKLRDGSEVNLLTGTDCNLNQRPERLSEQFHTFRWSLYPGWANNTNRPARFKVYGDYLKREWNRNHPPERAVVSFDIFCMRERIQIPRPAPRVELLYSDTGKESQLK
ncbi:MAG: hypothetical protein JWQ71_762 [Pedosphaera sp.]|nr:hypothetical protein [Pedosphaera sp.]